MSAYSDIFPWPNSYGHFSFFEDKMENHHQVISITKQENSVYNIKTRNDKNFRTFLCECYSFGMAEYFETIEKIGSIDAVIINSVWCGYTIDVKHYCWNNNVGMFKIGEFMAALNQKNPLKYLTQAQNEIFQENGWI